MRGGALVEVEPPGDGGRLADRARRDRQPLARAGQVAEVVPPPAEARVAHLPEVVVDARADRDAVAAAHVDAAADTRGDLR